MTVYNMIVIMTVMLGVDSQAWGVDSQGWGVHTQGWGSDSHSWGWENHQVVILGSMLLYSPWEKKDILRVALKKVKKKYYKLLYLCYSCE